MSNHCDGRLTNGASQTVSSSPDTVASSEQHPTAICFTWERLQNSVREIAEKIAKDAIPDIVVAVQRGGLVPGVILSHLLDVRTVVPFNVRRTLREGVDSPKTPPVLGTNVSFEQLRGKDLLVVDDIVGSGETLDFVVRCLVVCEPARIRTMACVVNRAHWDDLANGPPEETITYVGEQVRGWVTFPWEMDAPSNRC